MLCILLFFLFYLKFISLLIFFLIKLITKLTAKRKKKLYMCSCDFSVFVELLRMYVYLLLIYMSCLYVA